MLGIEVANSMLSKRSTGCSPKGTPRFCPTTGRSSSAWVPRNTVLRKSGILLVRQLLHEKHLLTPQHTLPHWRNALRLPGIAFDRMTRETWLQIGRITLDERVKRVPRPWSATSETPK